VDTDTTDIIHKITTDKTTSLTTIDMIIKPKEAINSTIGEHITLIKVLHNKIGGVIEILRKVTVIIGPIIKAIITTIITRTIKTIRIIIGVRRVTGEKIKEEGIKKEEITDQMIVRILTNSTNKLLYAY
jgi:hypothetical protein